MDYLNELFVCLDGEGFPFLAEDSGCTLSFVGEEMKATLWKQDVAPHISHDFFTVQQYLDALANVGEVYAWNIALDGEVVASGGE